MYIYTAEVQPETQKWKFYSKYNLIFTVRPQTRYWDNNNAACTSLGGKLYIPSSLAESLELFRRLTYSGDKYVIVGLRRYGNEYRGSFN